VEDAFNYTDSLFSLQDSDGKSSELFLAFDSHFSVPVEFRSKYGFTCHSLPDPGLDICMTL
jgi:hypothetical protein